jgi:hypothetical protein
MAIERDLARLGKYQRLYVYLRDRFANRVVLTFTEIEDLLGSSLPDAARREPQWWSATDTASEQSHAWTLAKRRADVNFAAGRVVFDRDQPDSARPRPE